MRPRAHQLLAILLHPAEEGAGDVHIKLGLVHLRPPTLLVAVRLRNLPPAERRQPAPVLRVLDDEAAVGGVVEAQGERLVPPAAVVLAVGQQVPEERGAEACATVLVLVGGCAAG